MANVRIKPYNENGYYDSDALSCDKGCRTEKSSLSETRLCIQDEFGSDEYFTLNYDDPECLEAYAAFVREEVEAMFPVQLYSYLCARNSSTTGKPYETISIKFIQFIFLFIYCTGSGWLTLKIKRVAVPLDENGGACDKDFGGDCDVYFRIYVDGYKVLDTRNSTEPKSVFDANIFWESEKIKKKTSIDIEVWIKMSICLHLMIYF